MGCDHGVSRAPLRGNRKERHPEKTVHGRSVFSMYVGIINGDNGGGGVELCLFSGVDAVRDCPRLRGSVCGLLTHQFQFAINIRTLAQSHNR